MGFVLLALATDGCAQAERRADPVAAGGAVAACDIARDRAAILSMAGKYAVNFSFQETEALQPGYQVKRPYRVGASELVIVVANDERHVVLQHILSVNDAGDSDPIKHWRQDWIFEDQTMLEHAGGARWVKRHLTPEQTRCGWTQAVYEIVDAPRYEGWGRFVHADGTSTWTSNETWRPLPRRERAREDYDVIVGVNRHIMTAGSWTHEQQNTKTILRGTPKGLVREHGVNLYLRDDKLDLSIASDYWQKRSVFWSDVRNAWDRVFAARDTLTFATDAGAKTLSADLADIEALKPGPARVAAAEAILLRHLETPVAGR